MNDTSKFSYILENLSYSPSLMTVILGVVIGAGMVFLMRSTFLYSYGALLIAHDTSDIARKKKTLGDLILMKDIQTELEKEIEQAMMKATFHG